MNFIIDTMRRINARPKQNPMQALWNFSLLFLLACLSIATFPLLLPITGTMALLVAIAKIRRRQREQRYSWSYYSDDHRYASAYRRKAYGRWS